MSEKFSLKWNDFQSVVSQSFSVLRREEDFFDVTLVSDDEIQITAHKLVLSACSDFFKSILKRNSHSHPLLYLSGVDSKSLGFVLDYIYHGEVQVYQHELDHFLDIAQKLKIKGLLSNEDPDPNPDYKESSKFQNKKEEPEAPSNHFSKMQEDSFIKPNMKRMVNLNDVSEINSQKIMSVSDMSEVNDKVLELIEKRDGRHHCTVCDYSSAKLFNAKEHVERHIEGLSYPCQFCGKTFRSKNVLRGHLYDKHRQ